MIDISEIEPSRLEHTPLGALFVPVAEGGSHFLAGRVGTLVDVLVALDGEDPFHIGETGTWSRAPGYIVQGGRFRVDPGSKMSASLFHDLPIGALLGTSAGPVLVGQSPRTGNRAVWLGEVNDAPTSDVLSVAFGCWQYVTGQDGAITVHYVHGAT